MAQSTSPASPPRPDVDRRRLFIGICIALLPTAFSFVLVSNILGQLKTEFILTNAHVGYIGGAAVWGMAISTLVIGPFLEKFGFKKAAVGAFFSHLLGVTFFLAAYPFAGDPFGFWILFLGSIGFGIGNGLIEVAGNPLTASLYPKQTTTKLNHFHAFFPGGMVAGGLLGFFMVQVGMVGPINIGHWTTQMMLVYIPVLIYGYLLLPAKFPRTRIAEAGIPIREMFRYTFTHPFFWLLVIVKMVTLSLELGAMRWIPEVLQAAGVHGMLVFVWITGIMMVLRFFAGPFVERFSPTGMLVGASVLTGTGLLMFALIPTGLVMLMVAATIFGCGVAFFFPTIVGYVSEQLPQTGSLGIVVVIGFAFLASGFAQGIMGQVADTYLPDALPEGQTVSILEQIEERFPAYVAEAEAVVDDPDELAALGYRPEDVENVLIHTERALEYYRTEGELHGNLTGNALRALQEAGLEQEQALTEEAYGILRPADNYGGRMAFLWMVPFAFLVAIFFLVLFIQDQRRGGYQVQHLETAEPTDGAPEKPTAPGDVEPKDAFEEGPGGA